MIRTTVLEKVNNSLEEQLEREMQLLNRKETFLEKVKRLFTNKKFNK